MCGLAGIFDLSRSHRRDELEDRVSRMAKALAHRGPDDSGSWVDEDAGIAFGHRRLAILDTGPMGHQPMVSADRRYVIVYNGEIYNFQELRRELATDGGAEASFRGHCDTEVLIEACAAWGVEATVGRLIGMFAFALWDRKERRLTLVRDRMGIKPLYWHQAGDRFAFASELKALHALPGFNATIDPCALASYLRHAYVPAPLSIYHGVSKLKPGHILEIDATGAVRQAPYWSLRAIATDAAQNGGDTDIEAAADALEPLLGDAIARRMIADVPLGAFLSGGIDSSVVVALMQAQSTRPVKTFTIGFHEQRYDEARHAKAVAAHLGTDHTELYVEPSHAMELVPRIADWYDEPFADPSQIPTFLVAEMTRRHVTVALTGDGGDELFAGYNRYYWANALWHRTGWAPMALRRGLGRALCALSPEAWDRLGNLVPEVWRPRQAGDKIHKLAGIMALDSQDAIYRRLVSFWHRPEDVMVGYEGQPGGNGGEIWDPALARDIPNFTQRMQYLDAVTYLPDDILTKVDRATMAVGLEGRVPLLDHRVVEHVWRLPMALKLRGSTTKRVLRHILYRHVPKDLVTRPKMGFAMPVDQWLRGPLRDWAEALLAPAKLEDGGLLDSTQIRRKWDQHLSGTRNWQYELWIILMFQAWRDRWAPS